MIHKIIHKIMAFALSIIAMASIFATSVFVEQGTVLCLTMPYRASNGVRLDKLTNFKERGHTAALRYGDTPLLRGYSLPRDVPDAFIGRFLILSI
ncbi:MAG: hypothetical protein HPY66_0609 [Firmicutes bacterium]|nr:hypothetical protein [Bacillota bacterium]